MSDDDPTQPIEPLPDASRPAPEPAPPAVAEPAATAAVTAASPAASAGSSAASTRPSSRRKLVGRLGQVAGIAGIVVCLALIVVVVLGRGWAIDQVNAVAADVDGGLARGVPLIATASDKVASVDERLTQLVGAVELVASATSPAPELVGALSERLSGLSERYVELRATYADAREKVVGALQAFQAIDRFVPGITIPQEPIDALEALDARVRELDASITSVIGEGGVVENLQEAAGSIGERLDKADQLLDQVSAGLVEAEQKLTDTRQRVADTASTVTTIISIGSFVFVLVLIWLAVLHWVLFRSASAARRGPPAS